jgi:hypothetical protein
MFCLLLITICHFFHGELNLMDIFGDFMVIHWLNKKSNLACHSDTG